MHMLESLLQLPHIESLMADRAAHQVIAQRNGLPGFLIGSSTQCNRVA
jgi:hypothetical protein